MSNAEVIVRYDGPALAEHKMDIEQVAPAMLALAELVKRANYLANGDRVSVRVLARADVEQHCFQFGFEIVQDLLERARTLLGDDDIKTAKEIAEWIGIIGGGALTSAGGVFGVMKLLRGRKPDEMNLTVQDGENVVQIKAGGDVYVVHPMTAKLLQDETAVNHAKAAALPVEQEGYESLEFHDSDGNVESINKDDARSIRDYPEPETPADTTLPASSIRAWVRIRKAVYDGTGKWTIQYDRSRDVTMNDLEWLERFQTNDVQAPPGSMLDVEMSVSEIALDKDGKPVKDPEYAIEKVHAVEPPSQQSSMFDAE